MDNEFPIRMRVTFDTNIVPADEVLRLAGDEYDFAAVTVTARELAGTSFEVYLEPLRMIQETAAFDESKWDESVWADDGGPLERLLAIISNGSFPKAGQRDSLSRRELAQLRDAMILSAHLREGRELFVTKDGTAFIDHGRREALQSEFATQIMTPKEFHTFVDKHRGDPFLTREP